MPTTTETIRLLIELEMRKALADLEKAQTEEKDAEDALKSLGKSAQVTAGMYSVFGDETEYLSKSQNELKSTIQRLISEGFSPESKEIQDLKSKYEVYGARLDEVRIASKKLDDTNVSLSGQFAALRDVMQGPIAAAGKVIHVMGRLERGAEALLIAADDDRGSFALLNAAFVASGDFSGKAAIGIAGLAEALQSKTGIDEDNIRTTGAMLKSMVGLNEEGIKKLIPSLLDFQVAAGKDAEAAVRALVATIEGGTDGLKRYGISIEGCTTDEEKLYSISKQLNEKFEGTAEAAYKAKSGLEGMKIQAGELKEALGRLLEANGGNWLIDNLTHGFEVIANKINDSVNNKKLEDLIQKTYVSGKTNLNDMQKYLLDTLTTSTELIDNLQKRFDEKQFVINWMLENPKDEFTKLFKSQYTNESIALQDLILRMKDKSLWDDKAIEDARKGKENQDQQIADQLAMNKATEDMRIGLKNITWQEEQMGEKFDDAAARAELLSKVIKDLETAEFTWDPKGFLAKFYQEQNATLNAIEASAKKKVPIVPAWKTESRLKEDYGETDEPPLRRLLYDKETEQAIQEKLSTLYAQTPEYIRAAKDETIAWVEAQRELAAAAGLSLEKFDKILANLKGASDYPIIIDWTPEKALKELEDRQGGGETADRAEELKRINSLFAETPEYSKAAKDDTIAWVEAQRELAAAAGLSLLKYDQILANLRGSIDYAEELGNTLQDVGVRMLHEGLIEFGRSLAEGDVSAGNILDTIASIGAEAAEQQGMMMITAGLSAIISKPDNPAGWGLLALGGGISIGSGIISGAINSSGQGGYDTLIVDPIRDAEEALAKARLDILKVELNAERDIREKALADLKETYSTEFEVLKDLWQRNLISTNEYRTRTSTLRTSENVEEAAIEAPYIAIQEEEDKYALELAAAKRQKLDQLEADLKYNTEMERNPYNPLASWILDQTIAELTRRIDKVRTATSISDVAAAKYGADFVTSGPQLLLVGDNPSGAERVRVEPLPAPRSRTSSDSNGMTVHIHGPVYGIEDFYQKLKVVREKVEGRGR